MTGGLDFNADILFAIEQLVPDDVVGRDQIASMRPEDAWLAYCNWLSRLVEPKPRTVHVSRELRAALPARTDRDAVRGVLSEIERGVDLQPRLSGRIRNFRDSKPGAPLRLRRDLDLMLNDWGVHHLHLGKRVAGRPFAERTGDLLFVSFRGDGAYAIAVMSHNDWANADVLAILVDNWPDQGVIHALRGVIGLASLVAPEERRSLREAGVSALFERNGRVFAPRGMLSLGGTSIAVTTEPLRTMSLIRRAERALGERPELLASLLRAAGSNPSPDHDWHLDVIGDAWVMHDRKHGDVVALPDIIAAAES